MSWAWELVKDWRVPLSVAVVVMVAFPWEQSCATSKVRPKWGTGGWVLIPFAHRFDWDRRLCNVSLKDFWDWTILQMNQQFLTHPCWDGICFLHREAADFFVTWLNWLNSGNTCSLLNERKDFSTKQRHTSFSHPFFFLHLLQNKN